MFLKDLYLLLIHLSNEKGTKTQTKIINTAVKPGVACRNFLLFSLFEFFFLWRSATGWGIGFTVEVLVAKFDVTLMLVVGGYEEAAHHHYKLLDAAKVAENIKERVDFASVRVLDVIELDLESC